MTAHTQRRAPRTDISSYFKCSVTARTKAVLGFCLACFVWGLVLGFFLLPKTADLSLKERHRLDLFVFKDSS